MVHLSPGYSRSKLPKPLAYMNPGPFMRNFNAAAGVSGVGHRACACGWVGGCARRPPTHKAIFSFKLGTQAKPWAMVSPGSSKVFEIAHIFAEFDEVFHFGNKSLMIY